MADDKPFSKATTRREAMKTALKAGVYAAPVILSITAPDTVSAQVSPPTGILTGTITEESDGAPIPSATVAVGSLSALTNTGGVYTIANAPSGSQSVQTSASGYLTRTDTVSIAAGGTTVFSTTLTFVASAPRRSSGGD